MISIHFREMESYEHWMTCVWSTCHFVESHVENMNQNKTENVFGSLVTKAEQFSNGKKGTSCALFTQNFEELGDYGYIF